MSELIEIPETASDVTPGITEALAPLPTTNATLSHKTMVGLASSRAEMMLHWFRLWSTLSNATGRYTKQAPKETPKFCGLTELPDKTSGATGASKPLPTAIAILSHELAADRRSSHTETVYPWPWPHARSLQDELSEPHWPTMFGARVDALDHTWAELELWLAAAQTRFLPTCAWPDIDPESTHEATMAVLRWWGRGAVADRLLYLRNLAREDPEESPVDLGSLRAMAHFLRSERQLPDPRIGVTSVGLVQIEWRVPTNGILAMEFLPSGLIRFAAVSAPVGSGVERLTVNGTLPKEETLAAVRPFTSCL